MAFTPRSVHELQCCTGYPTQGHCGVVHRKHRFQGLEKKRVPVVDTRNAYVLLLPVPLILLTDRFYSGFWQKCSYVCHLIRLGSARGAYFVDSLAPQSSRILNPIATVGRRTWPISSLILRMPESRTPVLFSLPSSFSSVVNLLHSATSSWNSTQHTNVSQNSPVIVL